MDRRAVVNASVEMIRLAFKLRASLDLDTDELIRMRRVRQEPLRSLHVAFLSNLAILREVWPHCSPRQCVDHAITITQAASHDVFSARSRSIKPAFGSGKPYSKRYVVSMTLRWMFAISDRTCPVEPIVARVHEAEISPKNARLLRDTLIENMPGILQWADEQSREPRLLQGMPSASVVRRRLRLKEAGLCSQCTTPHLPGRTRCRKHLDKANELMRRRSADRKTYGLCVRCPKKAAKDHVLCDECLARLRGRDIDWSEKNGKDRTIRQTRRSKGLCRHCDEPGFEGRSLCKEHLENDREKVRAYRAERKAKGLCWRCDEPARPGGVLCQHHRDEVTALERAPKMEMKMPTKRVNVRSRLITVRMPHELFDRLKRVASALKIPYQGLMKKAVDKGLGLVEAEYWARSKAYSKGNDREPSKPSSSRPRQPVRTAVALGRQAHARPRALLQR